jgi:ABC-type branched-subunit amino acid transport system substrate-binding protein
MDHRGTRVEVGGIRTALGSGLLILVIMQLSCAIPGLSSRRVSPEERQAYDSAMGHLPADPELTAADLERFLELYPQSPLADDAAEQLSELAFAAGRDEEGMRWLGRILSEYPDSDRAAAARLRLAQREYSRDRRDAARSLLKPLRLRDLSPSERRAALRLRVALSVTPVERILNLGQLRALLVSELEQRSDDRAAVQRLQDRLGVVDREILVLVEGAAPAELEVMLRELRGRPPAALVALEASRRALDSGQLELASERLDRARRLVRTELEERQLRLLRDRLEMLEETASTIAALPPLRELVDRPHPSTEGAQGTIGVVLPLTGRFAQFGQQGLRGVLLATHAFDERVSTTSEESSDRAANPSGRSASASTEIRVLVRDSEGDPGKAAAAVRELADEPDLLAIVGPIFSDESMAAAAAAESAGVPLVTLSHREDVPAGRAYVLRTRTTPADEVGGLVQYAFDVLGAQRFAVLYPRNRYGRGMRKLYWDAVTARGGKMVAASGYDPDATDFSDPIRDMIGYRFLTNRERKALKERSQLIEEARHLEPEEAAIVREAAYSVLGPELQPLPPIVDFDVLFIPDAAEKVVMIAPGLAFQEVVGVSLLGTSEWLDPELLKLAQRHLAGAVLSTSFYPESDIVFVADFVRGYRETFDRAPDAYAAQAFDAANLVMVQLASGRGDRRELLEGLLETRAYPGSTGVLTMRPDGNALRRPFLLGVQGRRFRSLD